MSLTRPHRFYTRSRPCIRRLTVTVARVRKNTTVLQSKDMDDIRYLRNDTILTSVDNWLPVVLHFYLNWKFNVVFRNVCCTMTDTDWEKSQISQLPFCQFVSRQVIRQNILCDSSLILMQKNTHAGKTYIVFIHVYELFCVETHFDTLAIGK